MSTAIKDLVGYVIESRDNDGCVWAAETRHHIGNLDEAIHAARVLRRDNFPREFRVTRALSEEFVEWHSGHFDDDRDGDRITAYCSVCNYLREASIDDVRVPDKFVCTACAAESARLAATREE